MAILRLRSTAGALRSGNHLRNSVFIVVSVGLAVETDLAQPITRYIAPGPPVLAVIRGTAAPVWEAWALEGRLVSDGTTLYPNRLQRLGLFTQARQRKLATVLNRSGSFSCVMPLDHPETARLQTNTPYLGAVELTRDDLVVWSGFLQTVEDDLVAGTRSLTYVGWGELLRKRLVQDQKTYGVSALNETQSLHFLNIVGGQFALSFQGNDTVFLDYIIPAATMEAALEALPNIGAGNVVVTRQGSFGDMIWNIEFTGIYAATNVDQLRVVQNQLVLSPPEGPGGFSISSTNQGVGAVNIDTLDIARDLISTQRTRYENGFREGSIVHSASPVAGVRTVNHGENVGDLIQQMSDTENGYDYGFYIQRDVNLQPLAPCIEYFFVGRYGNDKPDAVFEIGRNVLSLSRTYDGQILANRIEVVGGTGSAPAIAEDNASEGIYGLQDDLITLSDVSSSNVLNAYASIERILRANGHIIWTMLPMPDDGTKRVPAPFADYNLGDTVYLSAERGPVTVTNQGLRMFGIYVDIGDDGSEKVSSLQVSWNP